MSFRIGPAWLGIGCALVLAGCVGEFGIDDARFACTTDPQCGAGARCVAGVCVVGDASAPDSDGDSTDAVTPSDTPDATSDDTDDTDDSDAETAVAGNMCQAETPGATSGGPANFRVERRDADGRAVLVVTYQDLTTTVPLPPDMPVDFDTAGALGPLDACCENPCCPPYSSP